MTDGGGKEYNARVYLLPKFDLAVNPITLEDGALPEKDGEIAIDRYQNNTKTPVAIGDELSRCSARKRRRKSRRASQIRLTSPR